MLFFGINNLLVYYSGTVRSMYLTKLIEVFVLSVFVYVGTLLEKPKCIFILYSL